MTIVQAEDKSRTSAVILGDDAHSNVYGAA